MTQVNAQTVLAEKAYMLFYVRSTLSPKIPKNEYGSSITSQPASSDTQFSTTLSGSTVGNSNGTNGSISRGVTKPHLKFGSIAAFNGRVASHAENGAENLANGKPGIKVNGSHNGSSESNGISESDRLSSVMADTTDMPIWGPLPRPSSPVQAGRMGESSMLVASTLTDGVSAVSAQTQVTVSDPVGDNSVIFSKQNGVSSEDTSSCVMV